jgi:hypothetical protein
MGDSKFQWSQPGPAASGNVGARPANVNVAWPTLNAASGCPTTPGPAGVGRLTRAFCGHG